MFYTDEGKKTNKKLIIKLLLVAIILSLGFHSIFLININLYSDQVFYFSWLLIVNFINILIISFFEKR
jgi:hypothetical protein